MRQITKDLNTLKEDDLVTIILYCIYKLTDDPEYSTISELAYTLDRDSLYKLCATFGGTTLKIPTLKEYKTMAKVMLVFEYVNKGRTFSEACTEAGILDETELEDVTKMYSLMASILESYEK